MIAIAIAVARIGKLILIGPNTDRLALESHWEERGQDPSTMGNFIQYIECMHSEWKQTVHREIDAADCVLLYIAPKMEKFPLLKPAEVPSILEYYDAPFKKLSTGAGLLHEIAYLDCLGKIGNTVVICRERESNYVRELINANSLDLIFFTVTAGNSLRAGSPRLLAPDRQLARLQAAAGIVTFVGDDLDAPRSRFDRSLRPSVKVALRHRGTPKRVRRPSWQVLLGSSPTPRPLPPDNQLKIISHTKVEDLLHIPRGEIAEVPVEQAQSQLNRRAARKGCPTCGARIPKLFFYVDRLDIDPDDNIWAKCQNCMAGLLIEDRVLIEV
ncbi:hypothetical protein [Streptomyces olivochromogenes]|uniref:hypothetical protein n=1 Tax=Streptomyces olivochromogenes TaxID=1963 RepID=UPI003684CC14